MAKAYTCPAGEEIKWIVVSISKDICARNTATDWLEMMRWIRDPSRPGWFGSVMTSGSKGYVTFSDPNTAFEFKLTYG